MAHGIHATSSLRIVRMSQYKPNIQQMSQNQMRIPISQFDRCNSSGNMFLWGIHLEFQPKAMDGNDLDRKSSRLPHSVSIFPGRPTNLNQRLLKSKADWVRLFYHENTSLPLRSFFIALHSCSVSSKVASSVRRPLMTSTRGITGTGFLSHRKFSTCGMSGSNS